MRNQNGVNEDTLVIRRTVLHNLSVLVICRTVQSIDDQLKLLYTFGSKRWQFAWLMSSLVGKYVPDL